MEVNYEDIVRESYSPALIDVSPQSIGLNRPVHFFQKQQVGWSNLVAKASVTGGEGYSLVASRAVAGSTIDALVWDAAAITAITTFISAYNAFSAAFPKSSLVFIFEAFTTANPAASIQTDFHYGAVANNFPLVPGKWYANTTYSTTDATFYAFLNANLATSLQVIQLASMGWTARLHAFVAFSS